MSKLKDNIEKKYKTRVKFTKAQLDTLTKKERSFVDIFRAQSGVLYLKGKPGTAKSSIFRAIAEKLDLQFIDIRLSMHDETDVGLFPYLESLNIVKGDDNSSIKVLDHAVPAWAVKGNQKPTLIVFDELNRATLQVRNAALQILLERAIGTEFKFNHNVFMVACGNLGEEDGTDVEEFDSALNNRLIHIKHDMSLDEWIKSYANDNIHPSIVGFLIANPEYAYRTKDGSGKDIDDQPKSFPTYRTWEFLSNFLYSATADLDNVTNDTIHRLVMDNAAYYVGASASNKLSKYIGQQIDVNLKKIIADYPTVRKGLLAMGDNYGRDIRSSILQELKTMQAGTKDDLMNYNAKQMANLVMFLLDSPAKRIYRDDFVPTDKYTESDLKMLPKRKAELLQRNIWQEIDDDKYILEEDEVAGIVVHIFDRTSTTNETVEFQKAFQAPLYLPYILQIKQANATKKSK